METEQRKMAMEAEKRKMERLDSKLGRLRAEVEKLRSQREGQAQQRRLRMEILQGQKQDIDEKIQRAQDVLNKTNGMRQEYKDAMLQSGLGAGITNYILNVESQLCRALHGMYVLNRLYAARQKQVQTDKIALEKVVKQKKEEGGFNEFQGVKQLCQKELDMQTLSDWVEEQCHTQCELLSKLKERLDQALQLPSESTNQHSLITQPTNPSRIHLPAIDETSAVDIASSDQSEDDEEEEPKEDPKDIVLPTRADTVSFADTTIGQRQEIKKELNADGITNSTNNGPNATLVSFFMQHSKLDFEQQQRWLEAGNDSESYCTLFIGDFHDSFNKGSGGEEPCMDANSDERPTACTPVAQTA